MTLRPNELGALDVEPLLRAGVREVGVVDALFVGFCFNTIDRIADGLGFRLLTPEGYDKSADRLLKHGYR